ncbi:uncharacterized protein LOC108913750 isoform X2 [Anoplophora glabripennis]|uniref:uncharacterized protein LOC108913750 isoform X1 n=1 Tax=Anoplophora glabripennis TaxID=217634 RepID=UPI000C78D3D9|nr:uncharacterized protein LOC108913750 isoform X1 [Anoplophora glabripennis]XP_023311104.1 uncharacterized protein LOC108913750 isoform X2 [Anoplophora glabripennis]
MHRVAVVVIVLASIFTQNHASWGGHSLKSQPRGSRVMTDERSFYDCKHSICHSVENYPEEDINVAMEQHHSLKSLLSGAVFNVTTAVTIASRIHPFEETKSSQLCNAEGPAKYKPKAMRNLSNQWKIIVNTVKYRQVFTVEACRELSSPDAPDTSHYCRDVFHKKCRQNYQPLTLFVYEEGKIQFDKFLVPTTCKCCAE